jgi:LEA14-like dessication related protein
MKWQGRGGFRLISPLLVGRNLIRRTVGSLLLFFLTLLLGGCGSLLGEPTVECTGVTIAGIGAAGVDLDVALQVKNPNGFPIVVNGYRYSLTVKDLPFSKGSEVREISLPPRVTTDLTLPVRVPLASIVDLLASRPDPDRVPYGLEAVLDISTPAASRHLPIKSAGHFSVPARYRPDTYLQQLRRLLTLVQG